MRLYAAVGAEVHRTDLEGAITVTAQADGTYNVSTERSAPIPSPPDPAPSPTPSPSPSLPPSSQVYIQCVLYNPEGVDDGFETVTLYTDEATDVTGWWVQDEADHRFPLSGILAAGQPYPVRNSGSAVWNNGGDTAFLYDAQGGLVDSFGYAGGEVEACR